MIRKKKASCILIGMVVLMSLILSINPMLIPSEFKNESKTQPSAIEIREEQWLDNINFSTQDAWSFAKGAQGDNSTVDGNISNNQANLKVIGETETFADLYGIINSSTSLGWIEAQNGDFLLPDVSIINDSGCYVYHFLDESTGGGQVHNYPSVHWKKNISMSEDMSDFKIASASIEVIFNASVNINVDTPNDINRTTEIDRFAIGDDVTFYIEISDLENSYPFRIGEFKSEDLGQYDPPTHPSILNITDRELNYVSEQDLISALTSVLEDDNHNFTITLGMDIYCEDNFGGGGGDRDEWEALIIKSCNLTFTYEKKVEQYSSISLNQICNQINTSYQVTNAILNFDYKINQLWPTPLSPFSEIRILINDNLYSDTIRLSSATTNFQEAKSGGFDVSALISKGINITVSIQLFIADTFGLGTNLTISLDNVYLNITYSLTVPDYESNLSIFLNGEDKTLDPFIEIPLWGVVNVTVKFSDSLGIHLGGATIKLQGPGFIEDLNENTELEQYSVIINSTEKLSLGLNLLTLEAQLTNYQTKIIDPSISVRKINAKIDTFSGQNTINVKSGGSVSLEIIINNTDGEGFVKGAVVLYSGDLGSGVLTDPDNDGIYESTIRNIQEGSYTITVNAIGSEDYNFISFQLTINAITPEAPDWTSLILLLSGGILGIVLIFSLYQFHFKYPQMVRKVRKLRKKIRKGKKTKPIITLQRKEIIENNFKDQTSVIEFESELKKNQINKIKQEK